MREGLTEAVVQRCSAEKALPEISQNQEENTPDRPSVCNSIKMETWAQALSRKNTPLNTPLAEHLWWLFPN